jgi:hypothetical protein
MKIGLIDVDGKCYPNLALMKISQYHKMIGDQVEWVNFYEAYDRVYRSKIFTFSPDESHFVQSGEVLSGGTGYSIGSKLPEEIEVMKPDYSLYPQFKDAYGFLTRGCIRNCNWCIVPQKEGMIHAYSDIDDILDGRESAILMDNNVLAHEHGISQIKKIIRLGVRIDFNQGLDARLIAQDESIAELISKVKWIRFIRMACDTKSQMVVIDQALRNLNRYGVKNYRVLVYALIKDIADAKDRIMFLKEKNVSIFAQPYRDYQNSVVNPEANRFARWVNRRKLFYTIPYEQYNSAKG